VIEIGQNLAIDPKRLFNQIDKASLNGADWRCAGVDRRTVVRLRKPSVL